MSTAAVPSSAGAAGAPPRRVADTSAASGEPFVSQLRTGPEVIRLGDGTEPSIAIRVEVPEVWDAVRVETPPTEPVLAVKLRALDVLYPDVGFHDQFVTKFNGFEVRDESVSIGSIGAVNGSTLLLTFRRRRPVRD